MENNSTVVQTSHSNLNFTIQDYITAVFLCCVMYLILSTLGILTNIFNIRTFVVMGIRDAMTVSFILLSVSDLTFSLLSFVTGIGGILYVSELLFLNWFNLDPSIIGIFTSNLFTPLSAVVSLNTSFISVARCMCVSLPFYFKHMFRRRTAVIFMSTSLAFCVMLCVPVFSYIGVEDRFDPVHNRSRLSAWISPDEEYLRSIVWDILGMAIPLSTQGIIILSTIIMAHALAQSHRFRFANSQNYVVAKPKAREVSNSNAVSNTNPGKLTGKERQVVKQVVVISLFYIFSNTPKIIFLLAGIIVPGFSLNGHLGTVYVVVSCIRTVFEMIYPAISLPIYYTYNSKFRESVFKT